MKKGEKAEEAFAVVSEEYFNKTTTAESQIIVAENHHFENEKQNDLNRGRTRIVPAFDLCPQFFGEKKIEPAPYIRRNRVYVLQQF